MRLKIYVVLFLSFAMAMPALAESRSVTVNISCSVPAMMQMTARGVETNMPDRFSTTEKYELRSGGKTKVVSSTVS